MSPPLLDASTCKRSIAQYLSSTMILSSALCSDPYSSSVRRSAWHRASMAADRSSWIWACRSAIGTYVLDCMCIGDFRETSIIGRSGCLQSVILRVSMAVTSFPIEAHKSLNVTVECDPRYLDSNHFFSAGTLQWYSSLTFGLRRTLPDNTSRPRTSSIAYCP